MNKYFPIVSVAMVFYTLALLGYTNHRIDEVRKEDRMRWSPDGIFDVPSNAHLINEDYMRLVDRFKLLADVLGYEYQDAQSEPAKYVPIGQKEKDIYGLIYNKSGVTTENFYTADALGYKYVPPHDSHVDGKYVSKEERKNE